MLIYITRYMTGAHGTAKSAKDLLFALLASGQPVQVICPERCSTPPSAGGFPLGTPQWLVSPCECMPLPRRPDAQWPRRMLRWAKRRLQWARFRRLLAVREQDLVVVNGWASHDFSLPIRATTPARQILVVRESPRRFDGGDHRWTREQLMSGIQSYWGFIFVSDQCRKAWMSIPSLSPKPAFYVPNCCQEEEAALVLQTPRTDVRRRLGLPDDRFVCVCVGTFEHCKGQDILLDQMPYLTKALPNALILFVGDSASEYGARTRVRIETSPFGRWMAVVPRQESALELIYAADALILPSRTEAMPRVVLEAMVLDTPVVAANVDGVPELIQHGRSGLLFAPERPRDLVEGLRLLYGDRTVASRMAQCARDQYWAHFARVHQISRYTQIIAQILNNHTGSFPTRAAAGATGPQRR